MFCLYYKYQVIVSWDAQMKSKLRREAYCDGKLSTKVNKI